MISLTSSAPLLARLLLLAVCLTFLPRGVGAPPAIAASDTPEPTPYSEAWTATGPPGGDVRGLVVDPHDAERFYFGTLDGQIYISTDAAKSWRLLYNFNIPRLFVDHIIVDPRNSNTLYVGAHRHKEPGGFFKSTDGGRSWRASSELKYEALHSLAQSPSNPNLLIAGTFNGIFRSDDAGSSWQQLPTASQPGLVHVESLAIDPRDPNIIYAGTWYLPYKTTDGGRSWASIKNGIIDDSDIFAIDIDPRDRNHIIASACSGIYETRNAGNNWKKVQGIPSQSRRTRAIMQHPSIPGLVFAGTTEGFWRSDKGGDSDSWMVTTSRQLEINSIAVHPTHPETIYIGTNNYGVMVSNDGGRNFAPSNGGYSGRFANTIVADREAPSRIYASTINTTTGGGFFFISEDDGQTWHPAMRNMPARLITYSILQDTQNANVIYLGTNLGVYRSTDRANSWAPVAIAKPVAKPKAAARRRGKAPTGTPSKSTVAAPSRGVDLVRLAQVALNAAGYPVGKPDGHAGTQTIAAVRRFQSDKNLPVTGTLDSVTLAALGVAGSGAGNATDAVTMLTDAVNDLVAGMESDKPIILAATNSGLFKSSDPTKGWQRLPYGPNLDSHTTTVCSVARQPETIWVGTATSGVLLSTDGGKSWRQVDGVPRDAPINVIAQDPLQPARVYVGTKQAFFSSHDGGHKWTRRGGNLPFGDFTSIVINAQNSDEIFAGNAYQNGEFGGGVYHSTNAGLTWTRIDPKDRRLPSLRIWALALDTQHQNTLFVGSHSAGIYVVPRNSVSAAVGQSH